VAIASAIEIGFGVIKNNKSKEAKILIMDNDGL
jgi:hypothetical protein